LTEVTPAPSACVVSGMRATGALHLGHYKGVLQNWVQLQQGYRCFFFIADWHALTTHYADPNQIEAAVFDMAVDWLASGVDPKLSCLFIQSRVPEHAELHLLLSMITPLAWLERVPTYKDQQIKCANRDLRNYGFLGYPVLQSADILLYQGTHVPVGEDQASHVELTREIARRFNHLYGRGGDFKQQVQQALDKVDSSAQKRLAQAKKAYQEQGDQGALHKAKAFLDTDSALSAVERACLLAYVEGGGQKILSEPEALLTAYARVPGLDGQKMSKSYANVISLRASADEVAAGIRKMPTDPARVRRSDPGDPEKCPLWSLHQVFSDEATQAWAQQGCTGAGIGCLDCKKPLIDAINSELAPIRERVAVLMGNQDEVRRILAQGAQQAQAVAQETLKQVRQVMGLDYAGV
jgi:tryptophanyl-tRNA synthetase